MNLPKKDSGSFTMDSDQARTRLGHVALDPAIPVVAGSTGQWTLTLTVGSYGIDEGGTIKLAHRFASDWESPQFTDPTAPGFTTVRTDGDAKLRVRFDSKGHTRPWMKALVMDVYDGSLEPGDTVTVVLGDRSQGSPGMRAQTFIESSHVFQVFVDPTNACLVRPVPSPCVPIIPGQPVKLVCQLPPQAVAGQQLAPLIKGEDCWMNPTPSPEGTTLHWKGGGRVDIHGHTLLPVTPGEGYLEARAGELHCRSNWMTVHAQEPRMKKFWGDLHAQSDSTVGTGSEEDYFRFGRDQAGLDFTCHQGNDFQLTDEDWQRLNRVVKQFHQPGKFVVLPGYEWSANTPAGGDRNIIYDRDDQPIFRSSHWQVPEAAETALTPAHPADVLFQRIRENGNALVCAHVGGRYADIRKYFDPDICPLVEVVSCWGIFEWLLWDAFDCGYVVGIMANSDGHKGRPGAEGPGAGEFGIAGGLTCVLTAELTREGIFDALRQRRCYGTTGARIDLDYTVNGSPMGSILREGPRFTARYTVRGTAPLAMVEIFQGRTLLQTHRPRAFDGKPSAKVRVSWGGSRIRGRARRVKWDGTLRVDRAKIVSATGFAFDSPADGITGAGEKSVSFRSQTTGDTDGIELVLENAMEGNLVLDTPQGTWEVALADIPGSGSAKVIPVGEIDRRIRIERYPGMLQEDVMSGEFGIDAPVGVQTPYYIKATQADGQMAWASPVYIDLR